MKTAVLAALLAVGVAACAPVGVGMPKPKTAVKCITSIAGVVSSGHGQTKAAKACARALFQAARP